MDALRSAVKNSPVRSEHGFDVSNMTPQEYEQHKADIYNRSEGNLHEQDGYHCEACKNKGYIAGVEYSEMYGYWSEVLRRCKCMRARDALRRLNKSGLQDVVKEWTFDRYETPSPWQKSIKDAAMRFVADAEHDWFFIGGQSGAGKSHLCTAIAIHYLRKGHAVRYMVWKDEIKSIKACVNDTDRYTPMMQELKTAPVLYIDDLFKNANGEERHQMPTGADVDVAFEILNYRYLNKGLITIISGERTLSELLDIDEATAGRIAERTKAGGYCINLKRDSSRNWRLRGLGEI